MDRDRRCETWNIKRNQKKSLFEKNNANTFKKENWKMYHNLNVLHGIFVESDPQDTNADVRTPSSNIATNQHRLIT